MTAINITSVTGASFPYTVYVCDVYGNQCILIATILSPIPPTNNIVLPYQFNTVAAIGLKVIYGNGCEEFQVISCVPSDDDYKQFQDYENFEFMDFEIYDFQ